MAAAFKAALANVGNAVSGTTISLSTADIAVGDLVVVRWASDNLSATTPTVTASDGTANVYTVLRQGAVNATAAAGVAGGILVCKATVARPFASNLTLTFSGAVTAKAAYAESFTGALATVRSAAVGTTGTATAASAGASGTVAAGDLVLGFIANETRGVITGDSDTLNGSWSTQVSKPNATSGTDTGCVTAAGQYKIATASGAQTYNVTAVAAEWVIGCVVLQAALVPNAGTAGGNFDNSVSATGKKNPTATAATTWAATLSATGAAPIPPPPGSRPLESGVERTTEGAVARVLESFVEVGPPHQGSATTAYVEATTAAGRKAPRGASTTTYTEVVAGAGKKDPKGALTTAYVETVATAGKRTPKATAAVTHAWSAIAQGVAPAVGVNQGSGLVTYNEAASAVGKKAPKATATTSYSETVTAVGKRTPKGATTTAYTEAVTAAGKRTQKGASTTAYTEAVAAAGRKAPKATITTAHAWNAIAQGVKPAVGVKQGSGLVMFTEVPVASGKRVMKGTTATSVLWLPSTVGKRVPKGARIITNTWVLQANGAAPVLLVGYFTIGMQYGDRPVVAWQLDGEGAPV